MISINGTTISMTRGDTLRVTVGIKRSDGSDYTPETGDVIRFAMKKHYQDSETLVRKIIPNDTLMLYLQPSDTKSLRTGDYVYDIELTYASGDVDTFIANAKLTLLEEVD